MLKIPSLPNYSDKMLSRLLIATSIAIIGIFLGIVPSPNLNTYKLSLSSAAYADDINEETIEKYARAALQLERKRVQVFNQIRRITGTPPNFTCHQPNSLSNLSQKARNIAEKFCQDSIRIVQQNGLSSKKYNQITIQRRKNPSLDRRIQNAIEQI